MDTFLKAKEVGSEKPRTVRALEGAWRGIPYIISVWLHEINSTVIDGYTYHTTEEKAIQTF